MTLFKYIIIIIIIIILLKIKRFISATHIISRGAPSVQQKKTRRADMDIQDADYEDIQ